MKNRSEFASKVNELGKWTLHAVLWHLWHAPANALRVLWFAPRGLWRVVASIWGWVFDAEARSLRQDAIAMKSHEDHYKHAKLLQERGQPALKGVRRTHRIEPKVQTIRQERKQIRHELDHAERRLDTGRATFYRALELLDNRQTMYQQSNETVRTVLNRAFFTKLYVDGRKVTERKLQEPFDLLCETYRLYEDHRQASGTYRHQRAPETLRAALPRRYGGSKLRSSLTDSLARALCARGSSKAVMVEVLAAYSHTSSQR